MEAQGKGSVGARISGQVTVGLAGGSGSGKSTVAADLVDALQPLAVQVIGLDRFFKPSEELPTYYSLHHGEGRPDYNRPDSLNEVEMIRVCSVPAEADVVILDGHLSLFYDGLRALMDVKCFVEASIEEMLTRRTQRNLAADYGGGLDTILHYNRECVVPGYERYILPSKVHAGIIISNDTQQTRGAGVQQVCQSIRQTVNQTVNRSI